MGHASLMRRAVIRTEECADLELDGLRVPCTLRRSSARYTLALRVDAYGRVVVYMPLAMPVDRMAEFVRLHQDWLHRQLNQVCRAEDVWRPGALLPYLGQRLRLEEVRGIERPQQHADCLRVPDLAQAHESVPACIGARPNGNSPPDCMPYANAMTCRCRLGVCPMPEAVGAVYPPAGWSV